MINFEVTKCLSNLLQFNLLLGSQPRFQTDTLGGHSGILFHSRKLFEFYNNVTAGQLGEMVEVGQKEIIVAARTTLLPTPRSVSERKRNYFTVKVAHKKEI